MPGASEAKPDTGTRGSGWIRLILTGRRAEAAGLTERLEALGAQSVEFGPGAGGEALFTGEPGGFPLWETLEVAALFADFGTADSAARELETACPGCAPRLETVPGRNWVAAGRSGFEPRRFGRRLWIVPVWHRPPDPSAANVVIEPGLAFGTGAHPSSALCLDWLARAALDGACVLDYGTGSGILAIAAARLGARRVIAVDTEAQALVAARVNARRNGVAIEFMHPEALGETTADVVIANILAVPLIALAPELVARVRAAGTLVLAGVTEAQADVVAAAYAPDLRLAGRAGESGWTRLELRRKVRDGVSG